MTKSNPLRAIVRRILPSGFLSKNASKQDHEFQWWLDHKKRVGEFSYQNYPHFYTTHFGLTTDSYANKRVLDIGCGPMGSLEWATMALERVGLDPLADSYRKLGTDKHQMKYVSCGSENIPFPDGHFDIVTSFNSLDHVDDLTKTIAEICRVVRPGGGLFLLITDVDHDPTPCEPITYSFDIVKRFQPMLVLQEERRFERSEEGVYESLLANRPYDAANTQRRYGLLTAKFMRQ